MKIATRSSKLAIAQVQLLIDSLKDENLEFEIKKLITEGDKKVLMDRIYLIKLILYRILKIALYQKNLM